LEIRNGLVVDVVGPVVEVEDLGLGLARERRRGGRPAAADTALTATAACRDESRGRGERHGPHERATAEMRRVRVPDERQRHAVRIAHEINSLSRVGSPASTTLNSGSHTSRARVPGTPASLTRSLFCRKTTRVVPASVRMTRWVETPW